MIPPKLRFFPAAVLLTVTCLAGGRVQAAEPLSPTNSLWIELVAFSPGSVDLILHNTKPGQEYVLLRKQAVMDAEWSSAGTAQSPIDQNWVSVTLPFPDGFGSGFLWLRELYRQGALWLVMPPDALATPGQMNLVLNGTLPGAAYEVLTKESFSEPNWKPEQPLMPDATNNFTQFSVPLQSRTHLFVWARVAQVHGDSALWTADTAGLTADRDTGSVASGDGVPVTADTTQITTDVRQ